MSGGTYDNLADGQYGSNVKLHNLSRGSSFNNSLNDSNMQLQHQNTSYSAHTGGPERYRDNTLPESYQESYANHLPGAARQGSFRSNNSSAAPPAARVREDSFDISSGYRDNSYGHYDDRSQQSSHYGYPHNQVTMDHFGYNQPSNYQAGYDSHGGQGSGYSAYSQQGYDRRY